MSSTPSSPLRARARFQTDVGCERELNEDSFGFFNRGGVALLDPPGVLAVVADGMGGHSAGEVASRMAVDTLGEVFFADSTDPKSALTRAFAEANKRIYDGAVANPEQEGMGTTCTALVLRQGEAWVGHVGDSRVYLLRDGRLFRMTEDDSLVMDMVKRGVLSRSEAENHAEKNVILRALGTKPEAPTFTWPRPFPVRSGDRFLVCTDGLHDMVSDEGIRQALMAFEMEEACQALIELAKKAGGYDNVTVGILAVEDAVEPPGDGGAAPKSTRETKVEP